MTAPVVLEAYVRSALALQGYRMDEEQIQRVLLQFGRIDAIAEGVLQYEHPLHSEPAPVFRP